MIATAPPAIAEGQVKSLGEQLREDVCKSVHVECDGQMQVIAIDHWDGGFAVWDWVKRVTERPGGNHAWEGNSHFTFEVGRWLVDEETGWGDDD